METTSKPDKRHAACDECRTRKLKCTGTLPACARCARESITCIYSPQKPMGRPRKRRRDDGTEADIHASDSLGASMGFGTLATDELPSYADMAGFDAYSGGEPMMPTSAPEAMAFGEGVIDPFLGGMGSESSYGSGAGSAKPHAHVLNMQPSNGIAFSNGFANLSIPPYPPPNILNPLATASHNPSLPHSSLAPSATNPACACLPNLYLTLHTLQTLPSLTFPFPLPALRSALSVAVSMIACPACPTNTNSALLNVANINTLLSAVAERYVRVVRQIDADAAAAELAGRRKRVHMGDGDVQNLHLHSGDEECGARFCVELAPGEWRALARKVVRGEVIGAGGGRLGSSSGSSGANSASEASPLSSGSGEEGVGNEGVAGTRKSLLDVVGMMEERQKRFHSDPVCMKKQLEMFGYQATPTEEMNKDPLCLKMVSMIRLMIGTMGLE